jgi:LysM repeat protein
MINRFLNILLLLVLLLFYSCRATKPLAQSTAPKQSASDYINRYKDIAVSEMMRTGIPASITLAQGMIESDYGHSRLAREGNNHFGIKCHADWTGATIRHNDDKRNECFRKYKKAQESYYDHSDFLVSGSRYDFLFRLSNTDYKGWAKGLKKAGYATNPDYANMLIRTIEENNLMMFDEGYKIFGKYKEPLNPASVTDSVKSVKPVNDNSGSIVTVSRPVRVMENNRIQYITVKDGDTRESLEKEFQLLKWELPKYNELNDDFQPVPGQMLYLQPKRARAEAGRDNYTVTEGDTMYLISQKFGIKLKSLYELNRMNEGTEPETGRRMWLRVIKPVN